MTEDKEEEQIEIEKVIEPAEKPLDTTSTALIDKANDAAERMETANKELARLLSIQQKTIVENTLAGQTTAGQPELTKDEKELKNAKEFLAGTGMEDYAFPPKTKD